MAKKVVNIDDILAENTLEIKIQGKSFIAKDFDLAKFLRLMSEPEADNPDKQKEIICGELATAFEVEPSELDNLGLRALLEIIKQIRDWIVGEAEEAVGADNENP